MYQVRGHLVNFKDALPHDVHYTCSNLACEKNLDVLLSAERPQLMHHPARCYASGAVIAAASASNMYRCLKLQKRIVHISCVVAGFTPNKKVRASLPEEIRQMVMDYVKVSPPILRVWGLFGM